MAGIPLVLLWSLAALLTGAVSDGGAGRRAASREDSRPLPFFYDLYTFRGSGGATAVVGAFAVEAGELETEDADGRVRYRFSVTLARTPPRGPRLAGGWASRPATVGRMP
jgi:hypothetical protein